MAVTKFAIADAPLSRLYEDRPIELGDVIDSKSNSSISVGYGRYSGGAANEWTVTYDEAIVVTRGRFTIESDGKEHTAGPGETLFLEKGTKVVYRADEDVELVYVTHPHWRDAS